MPGAIDAADSLVAADATVATAQRHVALFALERGEGLGFLLNVNTQVREKGRDVDDATLTGCWVTTVAAEAGLAASMGACC